MRDVRWIKTDKHVFGAIWREHHKELAPFASFTNMAPSELSYQPEIMTEYGFKGADYALVKSVAKWDHGKRDATETHEYYIALPIKERAEE